MSKFISKIKSFFARLFGRKTKPSYTVSNSGVYVTGDKLGVNPPKQPR